MPIIASIAAATITGTVTYVTAAKRNVPLSAVTHMLHLRIEPLNMDIARTLPPPIVTVNGTVLNPPHNYPISGETTAIVDVSRAMAFVDLYKTRDKRQVQVLGDVAAIATGSITKLEELNRLALDSGACPGGAHGIPIPHGGDMAKYGSTVISDLKNARATIEPILQQPPPDASKL